MESFFSLSIPDQAGLVASILQILGTFWGCVCLFSTLIIGIFSGTFLAKRNLDAAYKAEREALRKQAENLEKIVKDLEAGNNDLLKQVPSGWLEVAEKERRDGNEERAIRHLKNGFIYATPSLARCCLEIAENHVSRLLDDPKNLLVAERYLKITMLLDNKNKRAVSLLDEVHIEKGIQAITHGLNPREFDEFEAFEEVIEPDPSLSPKQMILTISEHCKTYLVKGQYLIAFLLCRRNLIIASRYLSEHDPISLYIRYIHAMTLNNLGKYDLALKEINKLIPKMENILGEDHSYTLFARALYSGILNCLGRYDLALKEINGIIPLMGRILGSKDAETLAAIYSNILIIYNLKQYNLALQKINEFIPIIECVLGNNHPCTLFARALYSRILNGLSQYDLALQKINEFIPIIECVLGNNHPCTLFARNTRVLIFNDACQYKNALTEVEDVLPIEKRVLGKWHGETLRTHRLYVIILYNLDRYQEAFEEINKLIPIMESSLGESHPEIADAKDLRHEIIEKMRE